MQVPTGQRRDISVPVTMVADPDPHQLSCWIRVRTYEQIKLKFWKNYFLKCFKTFFSTFKALIKILIRIHMKILDPDQQKIIADPQPWQ